MSWNTWKKRQFHIRFQKAEEGGYIVSVPEMPGCVTQAESFSEGLEMIQDALRGLLHVASERGDPVPEQFRELVDELVSVSLRAKQATRS
jgi:antitoxin HicB